MFYLLTFSLAPHNHADFFFVVPIARQELPVRVLPDEVRAVGGVGAGWGQGGRMGSPHPLRRRGAVRQGHTREGGVKRGWLTGRTSVLW